MTTTTGPRVIDVTPTFQATASMLIALFENGTDEGKATARDELRRWASMLDAIKAERAEKEAGQ